MPEEPPSGPSEASDEPVLSELKGLIFLGRPELVNTYRTPRPGIRIDSLKILNDPEFMKIAETHLGKPLSLRTLDTITQEIILFYRKKGYPIVDALIPEQDVENGFVQLLVLEGKLAQLKVEGNRWFSGEHLRRQVRLRHGQPISAEQVEQDLQWLNLNPFREVNFVYSKGSNLGETDIILRVADRFPMRFYFGYEDTGNNSTGDERWIAGVNWGNAFFPDHQLNYQFSTSSDMQLLKAHSIVYVIPLEWRHTATFLGSFSTSRGDLAPGFDLLGESWQFTSKYDIPLPPLFDKRYTHDFTLSHDFKQTSSKLDFGGSQVFDRKTEISQFSATYSGNMADPYGSTSFSITGTWSPGGLSLNNKDVNFNASRATAENNYLYSRFDLTRLTYLPLDFTWITKASLQLSDGNLLGSEQIGIGGFNTIRGYEEREANGDEGWYLSNEFRTPSIPVGANLYGRRLNDQVQFLAFWEYGQVGNVDLLANEDPHIILNSLGLGFRYIVNPNLTARFDYGFQLTDSGVSDGRRASRAHLSIILSY